MEERVGYLILNMNHECAFEQCKTYIEDMGIVDDTLRVYDTATGVQVPTPGEMRLLLKKEQQKVLTERERAKAEREKAEVEKARSDRLADKLRQMGLDPDE